MKNSPLTQAALAVFALSVLVVLGTGCTKTVYMVQNPDGTWSEADTLVVDPGGGGALADDGILIDILTSNDYVLTGGELPLYLQVTVEARPTTVVRRGPLNLAIVIDRSGSMGGAKLHHAKLAARQLVDRLADGDRISLVSYASDVSVDVASTQVNRMSRASLHEAIDSMVAQGSTYLSGGLDAGVDEVRRYVGRERLSRVILLSDGRANVGVTSIEQLDMLAGRLLEEGISVSTMGLGVDYNEDLMTALAVAGGGNYYYIRRPSDLAAIFDTELDVLASLIGRDMILYLELPPGVDVQELYGYRYEKRGRELKVFVNSVSAGQKRRVLMSLDVPAGEVGPRVVARGRVEYRHEVKKANRKLNLRPVQVTYTPDRGRVERSLRRAVIEKLELVRNAQVRKAVMAKLDSGDRSGAQQVLSSRLRQSRTVHSRVGGASIQKQIVELEAMADEVRAAPAPSTPEYRHMKKARKAEALDMERR